MVDCINLAKDASCKLPCPVLTRSVVIIDSGAALSLFAFPSWVPKLTIYADSSIVSLHRVILKIFFRVEGLDTQLPSLQDAWDFQGRLQ